MENKELTQEERDLLKKEKSRERGRLYYQKNKEKVLEQYFKNNNHDK